MALLKDDVLAKLATVSGPDGVPLSQSGKLSDIVATDGKVFFSITVDAAAVKQWESVRERAEKAVRAVPGVQSVMIALTAERRQLAARRRAAPAAAARDSRRREAARMEPRRGLRDRRAFPALARSSRLRPAKAASANRPSRSILRLACATSGLRSAFSTPTFTGRRCQSSSPSAKSRRPSAARD